MYFARRMSTRIWDLEDSGIKTVKAQIREIETRRARLHEDLDRHERAFQAAKGLCAVLTMSSEATGSSATGFWFYVSAYEATPIDDRHSAIVSVERFLVPEWVDDAKKHRDAILRAKGTLGSAGPERVLYEPCTRCAKPAAVVGRVENDGDCCCETAHLYRLCLSCLNHELIGWISAPEGHAHQFNRLECFTATI